MNLTSKYIEDENGAKFAPISTPNAIRWPDGSNLNDKLGNISYNDLTDKPTIPVVPTNVSAFNNDAGYLTQHQDISGKEDVTTIVAPVNATDATLPITSLTCEIGKYYRIDVPVETLAVTLPAMTNVTTTKTVLIYLTGGTSPGITFSATDGKTINMQKGFDIKADEEYEINCLYNGISWVITHVVILNS